jgi:hypothetical protein
MEKCTSRRIPLQIAATSNEVLALCNDSTIWMLIKGTPERAPEWKIVLPIPQDKDE